MVAGQIGWLTSGSYPVIRVCDGDKTASKLFSASISAPNARIPGVSRNPIANGELMVVRYYDPAVPYDGHELLVGYGGLWYYTTELWQRSSTITSVQGGLLGIAKSSRTGTVPMVIISAGVNDVWICTTGWVQN